MDGVQDLLVAWLGFVVRGESPGCRLFGTASILEWLRKILPHHSLTVEQYGKMEPKYPEGGRCQSVLRPQGSIGLTVPDC